MLTGDEPPAFSLRSWREEQHACSYCSRTFSVAYGNPPDQPETRHNVAVRCPSCRAALAVAVPTDIAAQDVDVRPGGRGAK